MSYTANNPSSSHPHSSIASYLPPSVHPVPHEVSSAPNALAPGPDRHQSYHLISIPPKLRVSMLNTCQPQPASSSFLLGPQIGPTHCPQHHLHLPLHAQPPQHLGTDASGISYFFAPTSDRACVSSLSTKINPEHPQASVLAPPKQTH